MESISFTETVTRDVPGPNKRVFAYLVDAVAYSVALALLSMFVPQLGALWGYLLWSVYILLRDALGASLGKRLASLTILDGAGQPAGAASLILRNVPLVIPLVIVAEYFVMRSSSDGRRWGDRWANTRVQDRRPETSDGRFFWYSVGLVVVLALLQVFANRLAEERALTLGPAEERQLAEAVRQGVEAGLAQSSAAGAKGGADLQGKPLTDWIEALGDTSRAEEAERVIKGAGTSAAPALSTAVLTHANPVVRKAAADSLGDIGGAGSVAALLKAMKDPDGRVHAAAVFALYSRAVNRDPDIESAVPELAAALDDPVPGVRLDAAYALGAIGPGARSAVPALLAAIQKKESMVTFAEALAKVDVVAAREHTLSLLVSAYPREEWHVRSKIVDVLGEIGSPPDAVVPTLIRALDDENERVRYLAVSALEKIGPPAAAAIPRLTEALKDPHKRTREAAVRALATIRGQ